MSAVSLCAQADDAPKRRTFRKFTFRGIDLEKLMDLDSTQIMDLMHSRVRRRFARGLKRKPLGLIKRLRKEKTKVAPGEKPETVKTHLRDMIIVPEMIGSQIGIYNGKVFNTVEIKVSARQGSWSQRRSAPSPLLTVRPNRRRGWLSVLILRGLFPMQPEMVGHYLGEFSITYKPVSHGRAGIGATKSSRFVPLK